MGIYSKKVKIAGRTAAGREASPCRTIRPTAAARCCCCRSRACSSCAPDAGLKATPLDIVDNPKKLKIVELDAAQIPRSLDDVDAAAINTNFAMEAGLQAEAGRDRDRRPEGSVREHHRDSRRRQGQAVGREAGRGVSLAGSEAVHRKQVRGGGDRRLVSRGFAGVRDDRGNAELDGVGITRVCRPGFFEIKIERSFVIAVIPLRSDILQLEPPATIGCPRRSRYNVRWVDVFVTLERVHENPGASQKSGRLQREGPREVGRHGRRHREREDVDESVRRNRGGRSGASARSGRGDGSDRRVVRA